MTTRNSESIVERRTKLLKMEGTGFDRVDIVKQLSKEFQVSERTIHRDFQVRSDWQPQLTNHSDRKQAYYSVLNRFEQIYKKASFTYLNSKNESVKISSLRVMLDSLSRIRELANVSLEDVQGDMAYEITWKARESLLNESLKRKQEFDNWAENNLSAEEKKALHDAELTWARAQIKYENSKDEEVSIH